MYYSPELALKRISQQRGKPTEFLQCPSVVDYYKNTYAILSPIDLQINITEVDGNLDFTYNQSDHFFENFISLRTDKHSTFVTFSLEMQYLFYSDEPVTIEIIPAQMDADYHLTNIRLIQGSYDISKWYRPIGLSCEVIDYTKPVKFVRGTPMFYVRFITNGNKKIEIVKSNYSDDVSKVVKSCLGIKEISPNNAMEKNYTLASSFISSMKEKIFPKKKCPFSKIWKN